MNPEKCENCRFVEIRKGSEKEKVRCRRRLHVMATGSNAEIRMDMRSGIQRPTGQQLYHIGSLFPETRRDWWCGEYESEANAKLNA